jgi:putative transposase
MARLLRADVGEMVYHIINRANARAHIFNTDKEYKQFEQILTEGQERYAMRILAYCIMPNHWHLVVYPKKDGDMSSFMGWITNTHTRRWHTAHKSIGSGHLYQGRYKSFPVETDTYLLQLIRYVERNPLRARLVKKAENWKWSSLWRREYGSQEQKKLLSKLPIDIPNDYHTFINEPQTASELEDIRHSVIKSKSYGDIEWVEKISTKLGLEQTLHTPGRPKKNGD